MFGSASSGGSGPGSLVKALNASSRENLRKLVRDVIVSSTGVGKGTNIVSLNTKQQGCPAGYMLVPAEQREGVLSMFADAFHGAEKPDGGIAAGSKQKFRRVPYMFTSDGQMCVTKAIKPQIDLLRLRSELVARSKRGEASQVAQSYNQGRLATEAPFVAETLKKMKATKGLDRKDCEATAEHDWSLKIEMCVPPETIVSTVMNGVNKSSTDAQIAQEILRVAFTVGVDFSRTAFIDAVLALAAEELGKNVDSLTSAYNTELTNLKK